MQDEGRALLAAATRKRLLVYHLDGSELVELGDFSLADVACLAWLGDRLCAGVKQQCALCLLNAMEMNMGKGKKKAHDFSLADVACLAWLGERLCAGIKQQ